jgi:hypothetical protein
MGKTYTRVGGGSKSGSPVGKTGVTRSLNHGAGSVKGRLSAGVSASSKINTGRGSSSRSHIPSASARVASGGSAPQAGSTFRSHGHAALAAKTRATANRKGKTKVVRPGRKVPGPI